MGSSRATGWVLGTVVLVLAIFAGTWFFVAADRFEEAGLTLAEAQNTADRNDLLEIQIARLKADFENLDAYKAEIAAMQLQIPPSGQLSDYTETVSSVAEANKVTVTELSPGIPLTVVQAIAVEPEAEPEPAPEGDEPVDASPDTVQAPEPEAPPVLDGFAAVPMTFAVIGTYANAAAFLQQVQTGTDRLFLVTQIEGTRQTAAEATGGKPEIADGDLELRVTGYLYVLELAATAVPEDTTGEEPVEPPLPTSDRNPFAGLPGAVATDRG